MNRQDLEAFALLLVVGTLSGLSLAFWLSSDEPPIVDDAFAPRVALVGRRP